jgi:hypothetical protein
MRAIMLPYSALCGVCGTYLFIKYPHGAQPPAQAIAHCARPSCAEHNRHYAIDLEVVELQPAPTPEEP